MRVLAVCLGNICRSPTAEAALREAAAQDAFPIDLDSAGTAAFHVGKPPDRRMTRAARQDGLELGGSARQVEADDFERFDIILAMDRSNLADLQTVAPSPELAAKVRLFRSFDATATELDVPDPYYGGEEGFREVVAICRRAAAGFVDQMADGAL